MSCLNPRIDADDGGRKKTSRNGPLNNLIKLIVKKGRFAQPRRRQARIYYARMQIHIFEGLQGVDREREREGEKDAEGSWEK